MKTVKMLFWQAPNVVRGLDQLEGGYSGISGAGSSFRLTRLRFVRLAATSWNGQIQKIADVDAA
jgi:hypothetical protein